MSIELSVVNRTVAGVAVLPARSRTVALKVTTPPLTGAVEVQVARLAQAEQVHVELAALTWMRNVAGSIPLPLSPHSNTIGAMLGSNTAPAWGVKNETTGGSLSKGRAGSTVKVTWVVAWNPARSETPATMVIDPVGQPPAGRHDEYPLMLVHCTETGDPAWVKVKVEGSAPEPASVYRTSIGNLVSPVLEPIAGDTMVIAGARVSVVKLRSTVVTLPARSAIEATSRWRPSAAGVGGEQTRSAAPTVQSSGSDGPVIWSEKLPGARPLPASD
jgi:hypothetical protein